MRPSLGRIFSYPNNLCPATKSKRRRGKFGHDMIYVLSEPVFAQFWTIYLPYLKAGKHLGHSRMTKAHLTMPFPATDLKSLNSVQWMSLVLPQFYFTISFTLLNTFCTFLKDKQCEEASWALVRIFACVTLIYSLSTELTKFAWRSAIFLWKYECTRHRIFYENLRFLDNTRAKWNKFNAHRNVERY